jgi:hypothetical protein
MLFCEQCRIDKKWVRPRAYPYHSHQMGKCEICKKHNDCYDYPLLIVKPDSEKTVEDKMLYNRIQFEYHQKAEDLVIAFVSGRYAGAIDYLATAELKNIIAWTDKQKTEIDWYASYELRRRAQDGYLKARRHN